MACTSIFFRVRWPNAFLPASESCSRPLYFAYDARQCQRALAQSLADNTQNHHHNDSTCHNAPCVFEPPPVRPPITCVPGAVVRGALRRLEAPPLVPGHQIAHPSLVLRAQSHPRRDLAHVPGRAHRRLRGKPGVLQRLGGCAALQRVVSEHASQQVKADVVEALQAPPATLRCKEKRLCETRASSTTRGTRPTKHDRRVPSFVPAHLHPGDVHHEKRSRSTLRCARLCPPVPHSPEGAVRGRLLRQQPRDEGEFRQSFEVGPRFEGRVPARLEYTAELLELGCAGRLKDVILEEEEGHDAAN